MTHTDPRGLELCLEFNEVYAKLVAIAREGHYHGVNIFGTETSMVLEFDPKNALPQRLKGMVAMLDVGHKPKTLLPGGD
jgi:hypothetical protein